MCCHHNLLHTWHSTHGWGWSLCTPAWLSSRRWPPASVPWCPAPHCTPAAPAASPRHRSHHTPHPRTECRSHSHWRRTEEILIQIKFRIASKQGGVTEPELSCHSQKLTNNKKNQPATMESNRRRERHPVILLWDFMLVLLWLHWKLYRELGSSHSGSRAAAGYWIPASSLTRPRLLLTSNAGLLLVSQPQSRPLIGWRPLHGIMSWPSSLWANKIIPDYGARVYKINTDPDTNGGNKNAKGLGEIPNGLGLCLMLITLFPLPKSPSCCINH